MKPVYKKISEEVADDFTLVEKVTIIYLGLHVAKEIFFSATGIAFLQNKISVLQKNQWELLFTNEFNSCRQLEIQTYSDCARLEFKGRHLMDLAMNISFDRKDHWQGFTVSFDNIFFPALRKQH